jgi:hypothetical protein
MGNAKFLQALAGNLKQPQWIAVILSLGFHGALFAAGPSFSSLNMNALGGDLPEAERRQVPLIELTPEEQSRLPDFSSFPYDLSAQGDDPFQLFPPSGSSLPLNPQPGDPSDPLQSSPTPRPTGSASFGLVPPYTPPQRPTINFPLRRSPLSSLPRRPSITTGIPMPPAETTPTPTGPEEEPSSTELEADPPGGPTASDLALAAPDRQGEGAMSTPLDGTNGGGGEAPPQDPLQAQIENLAYRPENTTEEEAEANLEAWQTSLEESLPGDLETAPDPIEMRLSYVQRLCLDPEPEDALLGLLALPTETGGELELFPRVLKSTGYPFLDQEAVFALNDLKASPDTDDSEGTRPVLEPAVLYQVQVDVEYDQDSCIDRESLLEEIKANQETSQGTASPSPRPSATPNRSRPEDTPEPSPTPESESSPGETDEPASEPEAQPASPEAPGAEALR